MTRDHASPDHRFTNALVGQTSPYLLQHAHNPVDWHPWGTDAFELARAAGKPIFLSVGYSTCYWCHVMERQCFENEKIAALMNELFVNIKVDREERPDVDSIYMMAVQLISGRGGWPMSVFLTPPGSDGADDGGLKPFYAATYIPPEPAHGLAGMPQVLEGLSKAWHDRRDEVLQQARQVAYALNENLANAEVHGPLSTQLVQRAASQLLSQYDATHGGFGGAPKFPQPAKLQFILAAIEQNPGKGSELADALSHTLRQMALGGMYDQVGGGFHRYSTDERWLVPHFEKMLYDNAQLVETYLAAAASPALRSRDNLAQGALASDVDLFSRVAAETCDYVLREMTDATGAFWSAQDAEVDSLEGDNYLWTREEVEAVLKSQGQQRVDLAALAVRLYGLDAGPNFRDPHHADAQPRNVLHQPKALAEFAGANGLSVEQAVDVRRRINAALLAVRNQRKQPGTDDKVLVSWNGMMIAALANAGEQLGSQRYVEAAVRAAEYILTSMRDDAGGLHHAMRRGEINASVPALLEDYAFFIHGLIALHRATDQRRWLDDAVSLLKQATAKFGIEGGGYYDTPMNQSDLLVRTRSVQEGAIPSSGSQMVHNLLDLAELTGRSDYLDRALADLGSVGGLLSRGGASMAHWQHALLRLIEAAPDKVPQSAPQEHTEGATGQSRRRSLAVAVEPDVVDLTQPQSTVRVSLRIDPDYHVNAHDVANEHMVATELILEDGQGFELSVKYPAGTSKKYPFADEPILVYEKIVAMDATIRRIDGAAKVEENPKLVLRYQVCTDSSCLEPRQSVLPVTFTRS